MLTLGDLIIFCLPLSLPSFYLAYRLYRKQFLGTVFNQQVALMLVYSGGLYKPERDRFFEIKKIAHQSQIWFPDLVNSQYLPLLSTIYLSFVPGLVIPLSTATAVFRLLSDLDPFNHQEFVYFYLAPSICAAQRSLETLFHATWFYGSFVSVLFR